MVKNWAYHIIGLGLFLSLVPLFSYGQSCISSGSITEYVPGRISGGVDFTMIGATLNPQENNTVSEAQCGSFNPVLTASADLVVPAGDEIIAAYLYWSGTGDPDNNISLNGVAVNAERCWTQSVDFNSSSINLSSSWAEVTDQVIATGNATYTVSNWNRQSIYEQFRCSSNNGISVLYSGWSLLVVYRNEAVYDDFTIFIYDGLRNFQNDFINVVIQTNVFDKFEGSHVGLIAWEGDASPFASGNVDNILLNGQLLPSGGYTNPDNIYNGSNSFVNPVDNNFFNADIDDFDASSVVEQSQNTSQANFDFRLESGQDLVLLNSLVFRIPNEAPDARIDIPDLNFGCDTRTITFDYTYFNDIGATNILDAGTPIGFYLDGINGTQIGSDATDVALEPGESDTNTASITIPDGLNGDITIVASIDDPGIAGESNGTVLEIFETNNTDQIQSFIDQEYLGLEVDVDLCEGDSYRLPDGSTVSQDTDYDFNEVTVRGGCDSIGTLFVRFGESYDLEFDPVICEDDGFILPDGTEINPEPRSEPYTIVTNLLTEAGCDSIVTTILTVNPKGRFTETPELCLGDSFNLPDGQTVNAPGEYVTTLPGASANSCDSIVTTIINYIDIEYPTAITPNANGVNDGFHALFSDQCPIRPIDYEVHVYNRWGQKVFESNDFDEQWFGRFEGNADPGLYLWRAVYRFENGQSVEREGGVTLIR